MNVYAVEEKQPKKSGSVENQRWRNGNDVKDKNEAYPSTEETLNAHPVATE